MNSTDSADRLQSTPLVPPLSNERAVPAMSSTFQTSGDQSIEALLRESEQRYRRLADSVPNQVWTARPDGQLDYVNARAIEYYGRTFDELIGLRWQDLIHPNDLATVLERWTRSVATGEDYEVEFRLRRADGLYHWHIGRARAERDPDGHVIKWFGSNTDVEDLRRVEAELRAREEQFRALADSLPQLAWMADRSGNIYWYNHRWYDYTGTTLDEVRGWGWRTLHHPDHVERVVARIQRAWDTGEPWEDYFPLRGKDGRYRWFLSRAVPIRDATGQVDRWLGTNTDITELREAEAARDRALAEAKAERQQLYEVFMQVPAAIAVLEGPTHVFTVSNPIYCELTGHRGLIGKTVREAMPELEGQGFFELLDSVYQNGKPYRALESLIRLDRDHDGVPEDLYLDFVYQPLKDARGKTFGIMAHAVDVTEKVRAHEEIAAARAEADNANRAKSEFLAAMSHDLRTPLNAIGGYADLVRDGLYGPVTDAQVNAMKRIRRAEEHLLTLINDILTYAKIEAGRLTIEVVEIAVNRFLDELGMLVAPQIANKGLTYEFRPGPGDVRMRADRERATQIVLNLLTNAVKFTATGGIVVDWETTDADVLIHVRDTGPGIPADRLTAIFEPFVQAGAFTAPHREGVGLGLAISRELAHAMGGDLTVVSELGTGSTFTLRLPRAARA